MEHAKLMQLIEQRRIKQGLSKRKLASYACISYDYYYKLLKGEYTASYSIVLMLCKSVGLTLIPVDKELFDINAND